MGPLSSAASTGLLAGADTELGLAAFPSSYKPPNNFDFSFAPTNNNGHALPKSTASQSSFLSTVAPPTASPSSSSSSPSPPSLLEPAPTTAATWASVNPSHGGSRRLQDSPNSSQFATAFADSPNSSQFATAFAASPVKGKKGSQDNTVAPAKGQTEEGAGATSDKPAKMVQEPLPPTTNEMATAAAQWVRHAAVTSQRASEAAAYAVKQAEASRSASWNAVAQLNAILGKPEGEGFTESMDASKTAGTDAVKKGSLGLVSLFFPPGTPEDKNEHFGLQSFASKSATPRRAGSFL